MNRARWLRFAVLPLLLAGGVVAAQDGGLSQSCASRYRGIGLPKYLGDDPPNHTLVCRSGYVLSHNNETKMPDWVLEELTPARFDGPGDRDQSSFGPDPALLAQGTPVSVDSDYKGTGFDRGHMAPAADMKPSQQMMDESHYLSNIAPQVGIGFNRHIWAELEAAVRDWTEHRGKVIVITGPIYDDTDRVMKGSDIPVPPRFYKIVYEPGRKRAIAFILPNEKIAGRKLEPFLKSVDEVEEATGIDFLSALDNRIERRIERNQPQMWTR